MNRITIALVTIWLALVACGSSTSPRRLDLYSTETPLPTKTPYIIIHTQTPNATETPRIIVVSATPNAVIAVCVHSLETVYLRPAPNVQNAPITVLSNDTHITDLGGRSGIWLYVEVASGGLRGWVNSNYLEACK